MWDGDIGPNQIIGGLQCQAAELELYPVGGEKPWNDILKGGKIIRSIKAINFSEPQFLHIKIGGDNTHLPGSFNDEMRYCM